ncbi:GPI inositol-deacylase [Nocardioides coralli]|uniref:GPI inositol-deacylase n=1 Tax=Nocardioides coralli TaxID=2872154 RepID=UPI001CA39F20|nr:GPI inositol-deacylase [Nocardioides coralli]QZY29424.1 GPI inositol-deacylase [Nocardioides coralli]
MADGTPEMPELRVSGGAGGIDARYDDLERLGRLYGDTGGRLVAMAWDDKLEAADGDLVASAILSPDSFAAAEAAILEATYGPRGLVVRAATIEAQSVCFVACVELYRTADRARHAALETLHYGLGFAIGVNLPTVLLAGGLAYGGLRMSGVSDAELIAHLEDHPELLETLVGGGGGLLDGMAANPLTAPVMGALGLDGFHADTGAAADDLGALLFGDYRGALDQGYPEDVFAYDAPRDLGDLVEDLSQPADDTVPDGVISVQQLTRADGTVSWIVQLPGTDDFLAEDAIRNMGSNLNLIAGDDTAYGDAVALALAEAGVEADAPVMLVGHSQGGMQAAGLAADPDFGYHVTHVVTAGSPVATSGIPDEVTVLSLENTGDVVPLLDGESNPDTARHVTVQADVHGGSFGAGPGQNHSLSVYGDIADAADASTDPSVEAVLGSMRQQGFLAEEGDQVQTVTRSYQTRLGEQLRPAEIRDPLAMAGNLLP